MSESIAPILQWINAHPHLAGLATFIISAAESIAIIGTIVPGTVMMTAIGTLAGAGVIPLWSTIIWAILGAIVGDGISYWIGFYFKDRLHQVWPFRTHPNILETGEKFFRKHGGKSVFIGRFVGPVRALVPLVAGMLGMRPLRFTIANITSAIGWAPAYMLPGILLGAASLELPPDIAIHAILMVLLAALFIVLCAWLIQQLFILIRNQIDQMLTWIWVRLKQSRYFHLVTKALKHHNIRRTYGQLTLAFYLLLAIVAFLYLASYIAWYGPTQVFINNALFHMFRSFRTPFGDSLMVIFTMLGEARVLLPIFITLFLWFSYTKQWRTAWHTLALFILTLITRESIKVIVHAPRPWGILHSPTSFSFPSGHTLLATTVYFGLALLLIEALKPKRRWPLFVFFGFIVFAVSMSRLYLGAHWFSDVLGGWLLGTALLMVITLSYNRQAEHPPLRPTGIIVTFLLTLCVTFTVFYPSTYKKFLENYSRIDWPKSTITINSWWNRSAGDLLPLTRINRVGMQEQLLNIQWVEKLDTIKQILLANGWEVPPKRDWVSVLQRISDVKSTERLPLVSPVYLDKQPVLVLSKCYGEKRKLIILRLWESNLVMKDSTLPLWVGFIEIVPRTYSWLFRHTQSHLVATPEVLFQKMPNGYDIKQVVVESHFSQKHKLQSQTIILIKPKG